MDTEETRMHADYSEQSPAKGVERTGIRLSKEAIPRDEHGPAVAHDTDQPQEGGLYRDPAELEQEASLRGYELRSLDFAFDEAKRILDLQFSQSDHLDSKAGVVIGFSGIVVSVIVSSWPDMRALHLGWTTLVILALATALCTVAAFAGLACLWPQTYKTMPMIREMKQKYVTWEPSNVKYSLLYMAIGCYEVNASLLKDKAGRLRWALSLLVCAILAMACGTLWNLGAFFWFGSSTGIAP